MTSSPDPAQGEAAEPRRNRHQRRAASAWRAHRRDRNRQFRTRPAALPTGPMLAAVAHVSANLWTLYQRDGLPVPVTTYNAAQLLLHDAAAGRVEPGHAIGVAMFVANPDNDLAYVESTIQEIRVLDARVQARSASARMGTIAASLRRAAPRRRAPRPRTGRRRVARLAASAGPEEGPPPDPAPSAPRRGEHAPEIGGAS